MKRRLLSLPVLAVVALSLLASPAGNAGVQGNCSPEGTWYGYNTLGDVWIVTITRSGPQSFTTVMDYGANQVLPPAVSSTDWRGEFQRTGTTSYDWTTISILRAEESFPFEFALGICPLTAEFTSCDSWQGAGECEFRGFNHGQDPFTEGVPLPVETEPLEALFWRMPLGD